jgi:hypothetical protein
MPIACHAGEIAKMLIYNIYLSEMRRWGRAEASRPCRFPAILADALYWPLTIKADHLSYAR